jgi:hypothetical protein
MIQLIITVIGISIGVSIGFAVLGRLYRPAVHRARLGIRLLGPLDRK